MKRYQRPEIKPPTHKTWKAGTIAFLGREKAQEIFDRIAVLTKKYEKFLTSIAT